MRTTLLKVVFASIALFAFITTAQAQRYTSDTYGYACYNYFDNTNVTTTVAGVTTTSTSSAYSFSPDPTVAANNTSVVASAAANLSLTVPSGAGLQSKYQSTPKSIAINNIASADSVAYGPLNKNDWEWSFIYKSNLPGTTYPTLPTANVGITSNTANSWRYWIHASSATISNTTKGFYITQGADGCLAVYVQNGANTTARLLYYSTPLVNGQSYCIKIQRLTGAFWNLYVDPYTSTVTQAQTLRSSASSDNQTITLAYKNSVIEAENVSGQDGLFQFDEMHMYTRYCQFTGITSTANGVTPVPLYPGEGTVILYGEQIQMRGNYALGGQIYIGKTDGGYPEGNLTGATLYYTPNSYFSTASPATVSSSTLNLNGGTNAQASDLNDNFSSAGNTDGSLTTVGYYFITTTVNSTISQAGATMTFTGAMTVYDHAKNNSPIVCVGNPPAVSSTITFGSLFDWKGGSATSGLYLWSKGANWVGGTAPSASTDIARFGVYSTSYPYTQQPTIKANVSIGNIIVGTNITTSSGANTGGTAIFNLTTGSAATTLTLGSGLTINAGASLALNGYTSASPGKLTLSSGSSSTIASTGLLSATNTTITNNGTLKLLSDATGSATIGQLINSTVTGNVNVQRYVTGGSASYRGYRLFTSPVNVNSLTSFNSTVGYYGLSYLNTGSGTNAIITAGPSNSNADGFSVYNANPLIYLYDESRTSSTASFIAGKNVGISGYTGSSGSPAYSVTTLSTTGVATSGVQIPVGNSFLLYYVGSASSNVINSSRVPDAATVTTTGYINQGAVPVTFWNTSSTAIPYHTGTGGKLPGLNQVGNPYPSTINLNQVALDNPAISPQFWELDIPGGTYISYNTSGATSNARASQYIVSGQGFLVQALGTGETITFQEDQKVAYPTGFTTSSSPGALLLSMPTKPTLSNADVTAFNSMPPEQTSVALTGLHLQLTRDSVTNTQTGIYFSSKWSDTFNETEDAVDLDGTSPKVYLSSYSSDGVRLCINELGDYAKGKRIKLFASATTTGVYTLSLADIANIDTGMYRIYLVDNKMKDSIDITRYKSYAFNINTADTTTYGANRFALAVEHVLLPLYQLSKFWGQKVNTGVQLNWQTINEGNYTGFILQKLDGNGNYNSLYTIQSNGSSNYSYVDQHPAIGNNTYRLQQSDFNGNITYSAPVTINYNSTSPNGDITIYPNPSKTTITVSLTSNNTGNYTANIYNTSGTLIKSETVNANSWTEDVSNYKLGVYILQLTDSNGNLIGKSKFLKVN